MSSRMSTSTTTITSRKDLFVFLLLLSLSFFFLLSSFFVLVRPLSFFFFLFPFFFLFILLLSSSSFFLLLKFSSSSCDFLSHLTWEHRRPLLHQHFTSINSDVICLQEVQRTQYETDFLAFFRTLGYEGMLQDTTNDVAVATFYKTSKFTLNWNECRSRVMLTSLCMKVTEGEQEEQTSFSVSVIVCNVHLHSNPNEKATRFTQIKSMLKRCEARLARSTMAEAPIVVCGDFNSSIEEGASRTLMDGELTPEFREEGVQTTKEHFKHPFRFFDVHAKAEKRHPTFVVTDATYTIDQMFATVDLFDTVGLLSIKQKEMAEIMETKLPNHFHASDHLPVGCVLELTQKALEIHRRKATKT